MRNRFNKNLSQRAAAAAISAPVGSSIGAVSAASALFSPQCSPCASSGLSSSSLSSSSSSFSASSSHAVLAGGRTGGLFPEQRRRRIGSTSSNASLIFSYSTCSAAASLSSSLRHHSSPQSMMEDFPPPPPPAGTARLGGSLDIPDAPPASSSSSVSQQRASSSPPLALEPPISDSLRDVAQTKCPLCAVPVHIKELLQHMHNFHPTFADRDVLRRLVRERYTLLHGTIKRAWSLSAPPGATVNKAKGGFPCRHCPEDETGLRALFPTVDELMLHIGDRHEREGVDVDKEEPPARMTPEEVQVVVDRIRNGTGSGYPVNSNNNGASSSLVANGTSSAAVSVGDLLNGGGAPPMEGEWSSADGSAGGVFRCEHCGRTYESDLGLMQHYEGSHPEFYFAAEGIVEELFGENGTATTSQQQQQFGWVCPVPAPWNGIPRKLVSAPAASPTTTTTTTMAAAEVPDRYEVLDIPPPPASVLQQDGGVGDAAVNSPAAAAADTSVPAYFSNKVAAAEGMSRRVVIFRCEHCGRSSFSSQAAFADHLRDKHNLAPAAAISAAAVAAASAPHQMASAQSPETAAAAASGQQQEKEASVVAGYTCPHCSRIFTTFAGLEEHSRKKHVGLPLPSASMPTSGATGSVGGIAPPPPLSAAASSSSSSSSNLPPQPSIPSLNVVDSVSKNKNDVSSSSSSSPAGVPPPPPSSSATSGAGSATGSARAGANSWWCNTCNRGFSSGQALLGHMVGKHAHRTQPLPCPGCKRTCPDPFSLLDHITKSHGKTIDAAPYAAMCEGLSCPSCGLRFMNQKELDTHDLLTHAGQSPHQQKKAAGGGAGAQRWRSNF